MTINEFIEKFIDAVELETSDEICAETKFRDLDEWNSLGALSVISMFEDELNKELCVSDFKKAQTIQDLFDLAQ